MQHSDPMLMLLARRDSVFNFAFGHGRIAGVPVDQLLRRFDGEEQASRPLAYARSVVEYCSYIALRVETRRQDHLGDREFHSLTYDMMLAWEAPDEDTDAMFQVRSALPR